MVHESMIPNNFTSSGGDRDGYAGGMWIFAIVIIFFALVLIWRKDGHENNHINPGYGYGAMPMPVAAMPINHGSHDCGISREVWDVERDQMREFANLRQEIKETAWQASRESDKYFYDTARLIDRNNFDTAIGFKNNEILGLQNKGEIMGRIDGLENRINVDTIRKQGEEINQLKTIIGIRGLGFQPTQAVNVAPIGPGYGGYEHLPPAPAGYTWG